MVADWFCDIIPPRHRMLRCQAGRPGTFLFRPWWQQCPTESAWWLHHYRAWISISLDSIFPADFFIPVQMEGFSPTAMQKRLNTRAIPVKGAYQILKKSITGLSGSDAMTRQLLLDPLISYLKLKASPGYPGQHSHGTSKASSGRLTNPPAAPFHAHSVQVSD